MSPCSRTAPSALLLALLVACGGKGGGTPPVVCGASATVTASLPWQRFTAADWGPGCTLTVQAPALAAGERLAVLLLNADPAAADRSPATVGVVGTGAPSLAPVTPPLASLAAGATLVAPSGGDERLDDAGARRGEALVSALREETITRMLDGRLPRSLRASPSPGPAAALAPITATRSFCLERWGAVTPVPTTNPDGKKRFWLGATLAYQSAHAAFYYTDEVKSGIDAAVAARTGVAPAGVDPFWGELATAYETRILPALATYFGPESDLDGNGKMIFLFGNNGTVTSGAGKSFVAGYFWSADLISPAATATTCPQDIVGAVGNQADLLYLMDPGNYTANLGADPSTYPAVLAALVTGSYPGVMAHELQHNVNYNTRFPAAGPTGVREERWLNEGLSMVSETVAGYGLHTDSRRAAVRFYQGEAIPSTATTSPGVLYHRAFSMTIWEEDPDGNYAGVQAYMQYLLDHASPALTRALENPGLAGKANVATATGTAWDQGFARFVTAAMFSNEDASATPGGTVTSAGNLLATSPFSYLGDGVTPDYVPWHHYTDYCTVTVASPGFPVGTRVGKPRTAYVAYTALTAGGSSSVTLRKDGWAAFATGPGSGGPGTLTVQSSAAVRPQVVVVRYTGALPGYTPVSPLERCP